MLRRVLGLTAVIAALILLGALWAGVSDRLEHDIQEAELRDGLGGALSPSASFRLERLLDELEPEQRRQLLDAVARLDRDGLEDLLDVLESLDARQREDLLDAAAELMEGRSLDELAPAERQALEEMRRSLSASDERALQRLLDALRRDGSGDVATTPLGSSNAGGITGSSVTDPAPAPTSPASYRPDRRGGDEVVCYAVFDPALACAKRLLALDRVGADYALSASPSTWQDVQLGGSGQRFVGSFPVHLQAGQVTPIYSVAPDQDVVSWSLQPALGARLVKDQNDVFGLRALTSGEAVLTIEVVVASAYFDGIPPATAAQLPPPPQRSLPNVEAWLREQGLLDDPDKGRALARLQDMFLAYGGGAPLPFSQQPDFFLSVVEAEQGCCRHRATAFVAAAQVMGVHARAIVNEGHMFAEVRMPDGWVHVDVGGCGSYRIEDLGGRRMYGPTSGDNDALTHTGEGAVSRIRITGWPPVVRKDEAFMVEGNVLAGAPVAGAPVRIFINETKTTPGVEVGAGTTDGAGVFRIMVTFPAGLEPADYQLVAQHVGLERDGQTIRPSWSDPSFRVVAATRITPEVPSVAGAGAVDLAGRLTDSQGVPLAGRILSIEAGGAGFEATTDGDGRLRWAVLLPAGTHEVTFRFAGDDHLDPAEAAATVRVVDASFVPDAALPLTATPGGTLHVAGTVADVGGPVPGLDVFVRTPWGDEAAARTDGAGRVAWSLPVPPGHTGTGETVLASDDLGGVFSALPTWIRVVPAIEVPFPYYAGPGAVPVRVTAAGEPLQGVIVQAGAATAVTDADGIARPRMDLTGSTPVVYRIHGNATLQGATATVTLRPVTVSVEPRIIPAGHGELRLSMRTTPAVQGVPVDPPLLRVGNATVTGVAEERGGHHELVFVVGDLPAVVTLASGVPGHEARVPLTVTATPATAWGWLAAAVVVLALLAAAILARRRLVALASRLGRAPRFDLTVSQDGIVRRTICAAPDQPCTVVLEATGERAARLDVQARLDGQALPLDPRGPTCRLDLPPLPAGAYRLDVRARVPRAGRRRLRLDVHVGPWEEHMGRDFARVQDAMTGPGPWTPRRIEEALGGRIPAARLDEAMTAFERVRYGARPADADQWRLFAATFQGVTDAP